MFEPSKASTAQTFDIREDEEQYEKMLEILNLLISAGYYRAKIHGLSSFDKIVGGMVWCLSLCSESVNVDLLYSENSTIGQKISLTENIVKVLPNFKCPYALEPHQIQGLDCIHILPVMKWLVNEAIESKKRIGDEILNHSVFQFKQKGFKLPENFKAKVIKNEEKSIIPKRIYKRTTNMENLSISEDVKCTLMEYGHDITDTVVLPKIDEDLKKKEIETKIQNDLKIAEKIKSELEKSDETSKFEKIGGKVPSRIVNELIDANTLNDLEKMNENLEEKSEISLKNDLEELKKQNLSLKNEFNEEEQKYEKMKLESNELKKKYDEQQAILKKVDPEKLEEIKMMLAKVRAAKQNYRGYKRQCKAVIIDKEKRNDALKDSKPGDLTVIQKQKDEEYGELSKKLIQLDQELNEANQNLFKLKCQYDANPSQLEKTQYQKRFVELYNHMSSILREIKGLYNMYNMNIDIRNFTKKEIDLLNNIDDLKDKAIQDSYKDSFIKNLETILKSIETSLDKLSTKKEELQKKKDKNYDELQLLVDKQRIYSNALAEFQAECLTNQELHEKLKNQKYSLEQHFQNHLNTCNYNKTLYLYLGVAGSNYDVQFVNI